MLLQFTWKYSVGFLQLSAVTVYLGHDTHLGTVGFDRELHPHATHHKLLLLTGGGGFADVSTRARATAATHGRRGVVVATIMES